MSGNTGKTGNSEKYPWYNADNADNTKDPFAPKNGTSQGILTCGGKVCEENSYCNKNQECEKNPKGGRPKSKGKKKPSPSKTAHKRTARKHLCKDGVRRTVYTKDGKDYVMRRSSKTGKTRYVKV